jgi:hypothetical protein
VLGLAPFVFAFNPRGRQFKAVKLHLWDIGELEG